MCFSKLQFDNPEFVIGYRFSPEENSDPGISLEDTDYLVDRLCETELDYLHVSLGHYEQTSIRSENDFEMTLKRLVDRINSRKIFIGVGSAVTIDDTHRMLSYGVDMVAIGRQLLIDGKSVEKWEKDEKAYQAYQPKRKSEEHIPTNLDNIIMSTDGWVPIEKL
ncbi:MAG: hypothetical protein JEZ08_01485 [Clostridiales bacterium]|nr:hypothetical protein [Clostridiales bacterium]